MNSGHRAVCRGLRQGGIPSEIPTLSGIYNESGTFRLFREGDENCGLSK